MDSSEGILGRGISGCDRVAIRRWVTPLSVSGGPAVSDSIVQRLEKTLQILRIVLKVRILDGNIVP
jgi:hypothetical protein